MLKSVRVPKCREQYQETALARRSLFPEHRRFSRRRAPGQAAYSSTKVLIASSRENSSAVIVFPSHSDLNFALNFLRTRGGKSVPSVFNAWMIRSKSNVISSSGFRFAMLTFVSRQVATILHDVWCDQSPVAPMHDRPIDFES